MTQDKHQKIMHGSKTPDEFGNELIRHESTLAVRNAIILYLIIAIVWWLMTKWLQGGVVDIIFLCIATLTGWLVNSAFRLRFGRRGTLTNIAIWCVVFLILLGFLAGR